MYKVNEVWWSPEPPEGFFSQRLEPQIDIWYQQRYRYWVFNNIPRKRTMVDVGANIGIFARPSAQIFERVICFEPVSANFEALKLNMSDCTNAVLHPLGLSDRSQTVLFEMQKNKCGCSRQTTAATTDPDWINYECDLVTLDSFGLDQVDWIKVDVEGFEMSVLEGGRDTIKRNRPWLLLERNGQEQLHREWLNDLCGPYEAAPVKSKTNTIWIPQ
jgi:FkbM family methyltransferase|nr:FkbM family methyltransferase [Oxalobacteraceae bacterium]